MPLYELTGQESLRMAYFTYAGLITNSRTRLVRKESFSLLLQNYRNEIKSELSHIEYQLSEVVLSSIAPKFNHEQPDEVREMEGAERIILQKLGFEHPDLTELQS